MDNMSYMRAYLRLKSVANVSDFTDLEVMESFALLSPPKVTYEGWLNTLGMMFGVDEQQPEAQEPEEERMDPLERLKAQHQHLFKQGIVHIGPPVEEGKSDGNEPVSEASE